MSFPLFLLPTSPFLPLDLGSWVRQLAIFDMISLSRMPFNLGLVMEPKPGHLYIHSGLLDTEESMWTKLKQRPDQWTFFCQLLGNREVFFIVNCQAFEHQYGEEVPLEDKTQRKQSWEMERGRGREEGRVESERPTVLMTLDVIWAEETRLSHWYFRAAIAVSTPWWTHPKMYKWYVSSQWFYLFIWLGQVLVIACTIF